MLCQAVLDLSLKYVATGGAEKHSGRMGPPANWSWKAWMGQRHWKRLSKGFKPVLVWPGDPGHDPKY